MKVLVSGLYGFMGREVVKLAENGYCGAEVVAGVDNNITGKLDIPCAESFATADKNVDCIIDFSHHSLTNDLLAFAVENKIPAVIAVYEAFPLLANGKVDVLALKRDMAARAGV